ncbi:MAG: SAM-dependent methyltransferase [Alphaproteobacteria bacterium CG_4_9_14_3_um_filter_47_13]|nr:MAG: SAM-dependent methyltransferase [Alphaproteobacteria bacterium CG_4_9_14_3_um_filter_47_13]
MTLAETLKQHILHNGPLRIDHFMQQVTAHYYNKSDPFGSSGDFITAPEISQMFGEMLGLWVADCWMQMGSPDAFMLVECGPGRGTLMADALRATKHIRGFHKAAQIILLENSNFLKKQQEKRLEGCHVQWIDFFDHPVIQSSTKPLLLLANEFLDALPIRQMQFHQGEWRERVIGLDQAGNLQFGLAPASLLPAPAQGKEGDIAEISPAQHSFIQSLCACLKKQGGAALFIDYGYTQGHGDTLQAMKNHGYVDVLSHIGEADLTAHVDFSALARAAEPCTVFNPLTQSAFLQALGIKERAAMLIKNATASQKKAIEAALTRLIAPDQMGTLFKAIVLTSGSIIPAGFSKQTL